MKRRNWLDLFRKKVDSTDMDYSFSAVSAALGNYALSFFGEGVLPTDLYPSPFPITMDSGDLGGVVGAGIAFDPNGSITEIDPSSPTSKAFTIPPANPTNPRWDLLVIRYIQTGDTPIPEPSNPLDTINLNLHDDFQLAVIEGTPSITPAYPAKGTLDIILAGLQVPPAAVFGTSVGVDLSVREIAFPYRPVMPILVKETPAGLVNGTNTTYTLAGVPLNNQGVLVFIDGLAQNGVQAAVSGQTITMSVAPAPGQSVFAWYFELSPESILSGQHETPSGAVDGINSIFTLVGRAASLESTLVFVDGMLSPQSNWNLIETLSTAEIQFTAGNIPVAGQNVDVFYLVNPLTIGMGPSGPTSSGYVVRGTTGAPVQITATVGLSVTTDQRQQVFASGVTSGGAQPVTATPQIQAGSIIGQELKLKGTSDTDYPVFADGTGLSLNGVLNLKNHMTILLSWDGSVWSEDTRR